MTEKCYAGGCACGAIRYEASAASRFQVQCHCRKCQRCTGTGHAAKLGFSGDSVALQGELTFHTQLADSGSQVSRGFCPTCGSPVMAKNSGVPDLRFIHAASLDDPALFKPESAVWTSAAQPWDEIDPDLPKS